MFQTIKIFPFIVLTLLQTAAHGSVVVPPSPYGPVPTERQMAWHKMEFYGFVHFTVNTFTDKEWGYGDEAESLFNPTDFSAKQIAQTAKAAGMKGLILTCKHHDGFCLWPSRFTEHSVKNSPWKNGKGDVVREMSDACRKAGLKFGVYLSPWDRNRADYATPEYMTYFRNQLRELLTNYGPLFEVWFDGANGGDGYYGGAREKRAIGRDYYDWTNTMQLVHELQPDACIFGVSGADIRWVGNESGVAKDTSWNTLNFGSSRLGSGDRHGTLWQPVECDVSIRPGWFYHAKEDAHIKTPAQLLDLYYKSVGRGASFLLNLAPDRRGRIPAADVKSLREFRRQLDAVFSKNLAAGAKATASDVRGNDNYYAAKNALSGNGKKYWSTDDSVTLPELVLDLRKPTTFNVVSLREYLPLGQRVDAFALDQWQAGRWVQFAAGTSIGGRRLIRSDFITTRKVRLRITQSPVCPAISEIGLFADASATGSGFQVPLPLPTYGVAAPEATTPPLAPLQPAPLAPMGSVVRIDAGSKTNFTDAAGNIWLSDRGFEGGGLSIRGDDMKIENTVDAGLYRTERWGMSSFSQSLSNGKYVVKLHFAETYDGIGGPTQRVFSFNVQGHEFENFDVWTKAGGPRRAYVETVNVDIVNGKLEITFDSGTDNPEINGIEIIPAP
jgi:alpha-L-fucosidase